MLSPSALLYALLRGYLQHPLDMECCLKCLRYAMFHNVLPLTNIRAVM